MRRSLAVTLDLDGPSEYASLHGLRVEADPLLMYRAPLDRFCALCRALGGTGTLFAIGRDVRGEAAARLRELAREGFEIGCHSQTHDYGLSRRDRQTIGAELTQARQVLEVEACVSPTGFRAPGYHLSAALLDELVAQGFAYDSSVMGSLPYYLIKAAVLAAYRLTGRHSASLLGSPRLALAPRAPYRPGSDPYAPGRRNIVELPIAVATPLGLPVTGASLVLAWPAMRRLMVHALRHQVDVVINLHAMDFVDPETDHLPPALVARQPELRQPIERRDAVLRGALAALARGRRLTTCAEMAQNVSQR